MAKINIYGDLDSGSIFFINSTVDPKSLGTIVATQIDHNGQERIKIERNDRFQTDGVTFRVLFEKLNPNRVQNRNGEELVNQLGYTTQEVVDYINGQSQLTGSSGGDGTGTDVTDLSIDFKLDDTSTSVMLDNGYAFGVNTIKAVAGEDGLINIVSEQGDLVYFTKLDHANVTVNGGAVSGGLNDVVNTLNELFSVGAFESVVISDPYSTMVADVAGVVDGGTAVGSNAIDPAGTDILAASSSHYNRTGWVSEESIDQAGEYFTFDIRVTDSMGFGLILDQGADKYGAGSYADPAMFCNDSTSNSANWGYYWSHWFHSGNKGPWTYYGQRTSSSIREGWGAFASSDERVDYIADAPVKMKVGIDENGYMEVSWYDVSESTWRQVQRSSYVIEEGESLKLGVKIYGTRGRLHTTPKKHLLEPAAPTMQFRYIESPDGEFHYPLFATAEEANYYDEVTNGLASGTGASHTHTYVDDPTGTTWYMAGASHPVDYTPHTSAPSATTFSGNPVTYTEVTSVTNADLAPSAFTGIDYTYEEGTVVNLQLQPQGVTYTTSVDITPAGSGLVFSNGYLLQGTLNDVATNTQYTVTVTRSNAYGSSVGSFNINSTDVPVLPSNNTPWTKALDFSGSSEYATQVHSGNDYSPMKQTYTSQATSGSFGVTSTSSTARPWMCATVFKIDGHNSNQHIWNQGDGSSDRNIYLRVDANQNLYFGWGISGALNECRIATSISTMFWYGISIAYSGHRYGTGGSTAGNLYQMFDIRLMSSHNGTWDEITDVGTYNDWNSSASITGGRMDRQVVGPLTIGGRGSNRNFHGKVASFVVTTLKQGQAMPTDAEHEMMITDPVQWMTDYKVGKTYRRPTYSTNSSNWQKANTANYHEPANTTQVWLMGDGTNDSYSNMIRNQVNPGDQNATKLNMLSMVSNDIQTVNINGLT